MVEDDRSKIKEAINQDVIIKKINEVIDFTKTVQEGVVKELDGLKKEVDGLKSAVEKIKVPTLQKELDDIEKKVDATKSQAEKIVEAVKETIDAVPEVKKEEPKKE